MAARKKSGGPANMVTTGKPPCTPAPAAAQAVPIAAAAFPSPEKTTSPQNIHSLLKNGTQRKTAISHQTKCSPAAIASSGGAAHMATSGARRSNPASTDQAVPSAPTEPCRAAKTTSLPSCQPSPKSGTQLKTAPSHQKTSSPAAVAKFGGSVPKAMNTRP